MISFLIIKIGFVGILTFVLFDGVNSFASVSRSASQQGQQSFKSTLFMSEQPPDKDGELSKLFFDISVKDEPIGRLQFLVPSGNDALLPRHTENVLSLAKKSMTSIEPLCSYIKCDFQYSPQFIQGMPQYRWAHVMKGKGKNAVGRPNESLKEDDGVLQACTNSVYGGTYYGINYDQIVTQEDYPTVVLTVPINGPGWGTTTFSIVRVSESPQEWKERLLLNSAVIGWMEAPQSLQTLQTMARQQQGPPTITNSGVLE